MSEQLPVTDDMNDRSGISEFSNESFMLGERQVDLSFLIEPDELKRLEKKMNTSSARSLFVTMRELVRFMYLSLHAEVPVFFPGNQDMDSLWHHMIIETKRYRELCTRLKVGAFLDHTGTKFEDYVNEAGASAVHEEQLSWLASYFRNFGPISEESAGVLPLVAALSSRLSVDLVGLNDVAKALSAVASVSPSKSFVDLMKSSVTSNANEIDRNPAVLSAHLKQSLQVLSDSTDFPALPTNAELEFAFGASAALAFTMWQHFAAVERLSGLPEWQQKNRELWQQIGSCRTLCGLATTHLARPNGSSVTAATLPDGSFQVEGRAPWVCGYGIFEKLLLGFETEESVVFALINFPDSANRTVKIAKSEMICLEGTATIALDFQSLIVRPDQVVSFRKKGTAPPSARPTRYLIPELGIAKRALAEIESLIGRVKHPRMESVAVAYMAVAARVSAIEDARLSAASLDKLVVDRDEVNRDSLRLLSLASGSESMLAGNSLARRHLELIFLDSILHSPASMSQKILRTGDMRVPNA